MQINKSYYQQYKYLFLLLNSNWQVSTCFLFFYRDVNRTRLNHANTQKPQLKTHARIKHYSLQSASFNVITLTMGRDTQKTIIKVYDFYIKITILVCTIIIVYSYLTIKLVFVNKIFWYTYTSTSTSMFSSEIAILFQ